MWSSKKLRMFFSTIKELTTKLALTKNTLAKQPSDYAFVRNMQNFILVWLDRNIDEANNPECCYTLTQLRQTLDRIITFTDVDQCVDFITDLTEEKVFLIVSGSLGENLVPIINDVSQIEVIYIFCRNRARHSQWAQQWPKVRGVFAEIQSICEELKRITQHCEKNSVTLSFVAKNQNLSSPTLDQIDSSFMYTQILTEILLKIHFDKDPLKDLTDYMREQFANDPAELANITKLEAEYTLHEPIWWYTYECFLYPMLNRALRTMEVDLIIKLGFFIRDLHKNIEALHSEQYGEQRKAHPFTVYRGQGLSEMDFDRLRETQGGLLSFNNFLSTSTKQSVSLLFAQHSLSDPDLIGVLFVMTIDPSLSSTPFASVKKFSFERTEREILFSMHSVFRIGHIKPIEADNTRLWQVELTLTNDDDPQRRALTERIRTDIRSVTGWQYLGKFLIMIGQFKKAEEFYRILLDSTNGESDRAQFYHHLGVIKDGEEEYDMAIEFYEKSLQINREIRSPDHHYLASTYSGIGLAYFKKQDYTEALQSHEKALEIFQKSLSPNDSHLAISYGNIGRVYDAMGAYSQALLSHENALRIFQETLPPTHCWIATCYFDIGKVYDRMKDFSQALLSLEKALEIRERCLPPNHPLLAASCNSVGELCFKREEYTKGLSYVKRAIELGQRSLPADHPDLQLYKNNLDLCQITF